MVLHVLLHANLRFARLSPPRETGQLFATSEWFSSRYHLPWSPCSRGLAMQQTVRNCKDQRQTTNVILLMRFLRSLQKASIMKPSCLWSPPVGTSTTICPNRKCIHCVMRGTPSSCRANGMLAELVLKSPLADILQCQAQTGSAASVGAAPSVSSPPVATSPSTLTNSAVTTTPTGTAASSA